MSIVVLTGVSIYQNYQTGMLVGFLIIFVFFYFERIQRLIVEFNVKKIFGIELGEYDRAALLKRVQEAVIQQGIDLPEEKINAISDIALNQIIGAANKGRYFEEEVAYALQDLGLKFQKEVSGTVGGKNLLVDFVVDIDDSKVLGIEVVYSDQCYVSRKKIEQIVELVDALKKEDDLLRFVIITNAELRNEDKQYLMGREPLIDVIEQTVTPNGILSRVGSYVRQLKMPRAG